MTEKRARVPRINEGVYLNTSAISNYKAPVAHRVIRPAPDYLSRGIACPAPCILDGRYGIVLLWRCAKLLGAVPCRRCYR